MTPLETFVYYDVMKNPEIENDFRTGFDRFSPENLAANMPILELLTRIAEKKNATPSQIASAWLIVQKPFIVSILAHVTALI